MIEKRFAARVLGAIGIVAAVLLFAQVAHCAIATKKHDNSLGVVQYETNPFTYIEGGITNVSVIENGDTPALNLRIQPRATYALFTQEILFCDAERTAEKFAGKKGGVFVLAYETVAHRTVQGIGCHELATVDVVQEKQ